MLNWTGMFTRTATAAPSFFAGLNFHFARA